MPIKSMKPDEGSYQVANFLVSMTVCSPLQQIVVNRNRTHKPPGAAFPSVTISIKGPYPNVKGN